MTQLPIKLLCTAVLLGLGALSLVPVSVHARDNNQTAIIGILDGRDA